MKPQSIKLYVKPGCPWCLDAEDWLDRQGWEYQVLDVTRDPSARAEMVQLTGQTLAPSVDIDGYVLPDFDTRQLEKFLKNLGYDLK